LIYLTYLKYSSGVGIAVPLKASGSASPYFGAGRLIIDRKGIGKGYEPEIDAG
jgi:hypothetical protein